jgi:hypothetical protein
MEISERVTWEDCPTCGRPAAVGWVDKHLVEFDCPGGCRMSEEQSEVLRTRFGRPAIRWLTRY